MNKYYYFLFFLLLVSCVVKPDKGIDAIKIVNNSDDEIFVFHSRLSYYDNPAYAPSKKAYPSSKQEYNDFIEDKLVLPHSYKYYNELRNLFIGSLAMRGDSVWHMAVVNRLDF
ncbi:MAG: hypothetical protein J6V95_08740, partial [Bacteroidaceae bacterium]|nr:hypothetical protein [Bacteroidaceae bacterium]